jgi:hypothetical protein
MAHITANLSEKLSVRDKSYLAGLFDGEGCINCSWGSKPYFLIKQKKKIVRHFPQIAFIITNKSDLLLEIVKNQVGYGNFYRDGHRGVYSYRVSHREEILDLINALRPYVKLKREPLNIAKDALEYHIKRGHSAWTREQKSFFYENYMAKLEKLLPQGRKRGRPSKYVLSDRLS